MMKAFEKPDILIRRFSVEDMLTNSSVTGGDDTPQQPAVHPGTTPEPGINL